MSGCIWGGSGKFWELLGASISVSLWGPLGAFGEPQGAFGSFPLGASGNLWGLGLWEPLGASKGLLGASGSF